MESKSIWEETADTGKDFPALTKNAEADVVIIGAGITGLTAAMLLSDAGKKVIVLEAMKIGLGTTGNSTGNLYATVDEHLSHLKKKWNIEIVRDIVQSRNAGINLIESTINKYNIQCDFVRTSFNFFAETVDKKIEDFMKEETEALEEAGLAVNSSVHIGLPFEVRMAISVNNQAQFHPLNYVRQLAKNISAKCEIYENTPVMDFDEDAGTVKIKSGATVKAKTVIMATHTPKGVFFVQTVLAPYREHGVAAEMLGSEFPTGIFWGVNEPKHSIRKYKQGDKEYVMVIGDKYKTGQAHDTTEYVKGLEQFMKKRFDVSATKYIWGGQQYRANDGLPYIGKHSDKLYMATGFASDGLTYGTVAAMIISDEILEKSNPWEKLYDFKRHTPAKSFKEFFKENINVAAQYIKDFPGKVDAKDIDEVKNCEGKIIQKNNEKLAVYRDENGKAHVVSAVCTHMKCIVNWNQSERTWDCPCHGSRFKFDGQVIEGPAIDNLPTKPL